MDAVNRSQLFITLARYHGAGMTLDMALDEWSREDVRAGKAASRTASLVRGGMALDRAGTRCKLFRPWEARLIKLGNQHGRLDLTLGSISRYYENSARWWRRLRSKLMLPAAVLILGLMILPLPGLMSGQLSIAAYLGMNALLIVAVLIGWRQLAQVSGYPKILDGFLDLGALGHLLRVYHRSQFLNALALLYEAGVPLLQAIDETLDVCNSSRLSSRWQPLAEHLRTGTLLAQGLKQVGIVDDTGYALLSSGEASGKLTEMLKHERDRLEDELELKLEIIGEWLPRIIYFGVIILLFGQFA